VNYALLLIIAIVYVFYFFRTENAENGSAKLPYFIFISSDEKKQFAYLSCNVLSKSTQLLCSGAESEHN
jgi:hypothetical protein